MKFATSGGRRRHFARKTNSRLSAHLKPRCRWMDQGAGTKAKLSDRHCSSLAHLRHYAAQRGSGAMCYQQIAVKLREAISRHQMCWDPVDLLRINRLLNGSVDKGPFVGDARILRYDAVVKAFNICDVCESGPYWQLGQAQVQES